MKKTFKQKPAPEEVKAYEEKLNYYLRALKGSVKITLLEAPVVITSYSSFDESETVEYFWIDSVTFTAPGVNLDIDTIFSEYAPTKEKYFDEKLAWTDAVEIQNEVYKKLGKFKDGFGTNNGDPYWKLWEHIPTDD